VVVKFEAERCLHAPQFRGNGKADYLARPRAAELFFKHHMTRRPRSKPSSQTNSVFALGHLTTISSAPNGFIETALCRHRWTAQRGYQDFWQPPNQAVASVREQPKLTGRKRLRIRNRQRPRDLAQGQERIISRSPATGLATPCLECESAGLNGPGLRQCEDCRLGSRL
jgi:hypothetical protein